MQHKRFRAAHALLVLTAMDKRAAQGTLDEKAEALLRQAEDFIRGMTGSSLLPAIREWRDSGPHSCDPFGGLSRTVASASYEDTAMRGRR